MFDFFKNIFDSMFGGKEEEDDTDFSWGGIGGEEESWSADLGDPEGFSADISGLEDRILDDPGDEFVQEFYDIDSLIEYLEGTPETVLKFYMDPEEEVYYVYRYNSE